MKYRLIGSASSLYELLALIKKQWFWNESHAVESDIPGIFWVASSKGIVDGLRIVQKNKRYRLEIEET